MPAWPCTSSPVLCCFVFTLSFQPHQTPHSSSNLAASSPTCGMVLAVPSTQMLSLCTATGLASAPPSGLHQIALQGSLPRPPVQNGKPSLSLTLNSSLLHAGPLFLRHGLGHPVFISHILTQQRGRESPSSPSAKAGLGLRCLPWQLGSS